MTLTNFKMEELQNTLIPFLDRTDIIGYYAARNFRNLNNHISEYLEIKERLVRKYGKPCKDEQGNDTGRIEVAYDSPVFSKFIDELMPIGNIEQEIDVFKLPFAEAIDKLSGNELLSIDWMFEE